MRVLEAARSAPWAMLPERVAELIEIAGRENEVTPEALEAYRARSVPSAEKLGLRGNVAVLPVIGPLFRRANLFTEFSGATSYDILRRDFQVALDDPSITAIVLNVDSPGGEANGCDELAAAIYAARSQKRIVSYVGGMAASGGYWIASAASEIVVAEGALLGSIGVALAVTDTSARDERNGVKRIEFVSSQSPHKRPDPQSDSGREQLQRMVDQLATVFIAAVARHRGVSEAKVLETFGQGGVETGAQAIAAGMADRVGSFEGVVADLSRASDGRTPSQSRRLSMSETNGGPAAETAGISKADHDRAVAAARSEGETAGATSERGRIAAVIAAEGVEGNPAKISAAVDLAIKSPGMAAEDVASFVAANVHAPAQVSTASLAARQAANQEGDLPVADAGGDKPARSRLSASVDAAVASMKRS
ncbi:S49 family peptidase [Aurantimonas sp. VKM B-3413]|uniref:S49 family peptidase n=1 Tax=Aurantimonas sp. VKM B-3413 TaxID=2779401 RepID=UPI001E3D1F20|nr:S49 family peptidase [Aurantimonas sp. VKM B-3413]MCB8835946.1 S49 family peptidase [Aurantimonas sp. VKM B-3413]